MKVWLVCGVVGPSPLLAEVPVCYSPPLLAGFRCRWWWAFLATPGGGSRARFPATPGWVSLSAVVCGVWCVVCGVRRWCVGGVVAGVWCGWSLATPGGGSCVLLPATPGWVSLPVVVRGPRHSWLRVPGAVPRHSWLGSAGGGGVWCLVCGGGVLVVAGVWCGGSLATPGGGSCVLLPATPGWVSRSAVVVTLSSTLLPGMHFFPASALVRVSVFFLPGSSFTLVGPSLLNLRRERMQTGARRRRFCRAMAPRQCHPRSVSYSRGGVVRYLFMLRSCAPLFFFLPCCACFGVFFRASLGVGLYPTCSRLGSTHLFGRHLCSLSVPRARRDMQHTCFFFPSYHNLSVS